MQNRLPVDSEESVKLSVFHLVLSASEEPRQRVFTMSIYWFQPKEENRKAKLCVHFSVCISMLCVIAFLMRSVFKVFFHICMKVLICSFASKGSSVRLLLVFSSETQISLKKLWKKGVAAKDNTWIFSVPFEDSWWLGFVFFSHCHSWQLSSNVLQNRSKHLEKVHVVLGSKSCDLDSLISAVAYAYFLDKVRKKKKPTNKRILFVTGYYWILLLSQLRHPIKTSVLEMIT